MCICGNLTPFEECCAPLISHQCQPETPQQLMRSRYSAYVKSDAKYLVFSSVCENQTEEDMVDIENFSSQVEWLKLDVINAIDERVEFKAYYRDKDGVQVLHEKSNFVLVDGVWKYKDGALYNSKIERNEPCPCASGKKFKKCCSK
ncbi:MAG: YchJ family metal-binding protein [Campylobacterota bacterium]|nr:YchJ family metal-binding protein [Campylobacterota bacterium]